MQSTNNSNSHNTTSVANEYVVDKLIEQSKESERNRIARYDHERTLKDERLQRDIRKSEVSRKIESLEVETSNQKMSLTAKDTEIARLMEVIAGQSCGACNINKNLHEKNELYNKEKAKASKLNAEKRKLLDMMRMYLPDDNFDRIFDEYKGWQETKLAKKKEGK